MHVCIIHVWVITIVCVCVCVCPIPSLLILTLCVVHYEMALCTCSVAVNNESIYLHTQSTTSRYVVASPPSPPPPPSQERHLQDVILAQQTNGNGGGSDVVKSNIFIPTPEAAITTPHYSTVYNKLSEKPPPFIRVPGVVSLPSLLLSLCLDSLCNYYFLSLLSVV